jgi:hypothetical protein
VVECWHVLGTVEVRTTWNFTFHHRIRHATFTW